MSDEAVATGGAEIELASSHAVEIWTEDPSLAAGARESPDLPLVALGPAFEGLLSIVQAVEAGSLLRIVGPTPLLKGISDGSLELVRTGGAKTGTVVDKATGKFVGQLRFKDAARLLPTAAAAFQVASMVTMQYYLAEITARIDAISGQIANVMGFLESEAMAEVVVAFDASRDLAATFTSRGHLPERDFSKLHLAEHTASVAYERDLSLLQVFVDKTNELGHLYELAAATIGTAKFPKGVNRLKSLLKQVGDESSAQQRTFARLVIASVARARLLLVRYAGEAHDAPDLAEAAPARAKEELAAMRRELDQLAVAFEIPMAIDDDVLSKLLVADGKPRGAVATYRQNFHGLLDSVLPWLRTLDDLRDAEIGALQLTGGSAGIAQQHRAIGPGA